MNTDQVKKSIRRSICDEINRRLTHDRLLNKLKPLSEKDVRTFITTNKQHIEDDVYTFFEEYEELNKKRQQMLLTSVSNVWFADIAEYWFKNVYLTPDPLTISVERIFC